VNPPDRRAATSTPDAGRSHLAWAGVGLALAGIAALTLVPAPALLERVERTPLWCVLCGDLYAIDFLLNIALFVPLGVALRLAGCPRVRAQALACATTLAVESLQIAVLPGRDASLGDLLTNSAGAALGIALAERGRALLLPTPEQSRRLVLLASALWLLLWSFSGWALQLALPPARWFAMVPPRDVYLVDFPGSVGSATANGVRLGNAEIAEAGDLRRSFAGQGIALEANGALGAPAPAFLTGLASIFTENQKEVLVLGQHHQDLVFRLRLRAADLGMRSPTLRLDDLLAGPAGAEFHAQARFARGQLWIEGIAGSRNGSARLALGPSLGWSLLLPFEYTFGPEAPWWTALWIAASLLPCGYWVRRAGGATPRRRWLAPPLLAVALGLLAVPLALGLPSVERSEWVAAAYGLLAGSLLGSASLRWPRSS
jgi:VanZ family protein